MDRIFPNGKSLSPMKNRVIGFLDQQILKSPERNILLVTHAVSIRALLSEYGNRYFAELYTREVKRKIYLFVFNRQVRTRIYIFNRT